MKIEFEPIELWDFDRYGVAFPVDIDGKRIRCVVAVEALQNHYGLKGMGAAAVSVFRANREDFEKLVVDRLNMGVTDDPIILTSGDF